MEEVKSSVIKSAVCFFLFLTGADPEHRPERSEANEGSNKRDARDCK